MSGLNGKGNIKGMAGWDILVYIDGFGGRQREVEGVVGVVAEILFADVGGRDGHDVVFL
jgi:hypothetical protein